MEEQTELLLQHRLAATEREFGPEHLEVATSLNNLAMFYYSQGKYAQAEPLYQRALSICEQVLGPDHPYTATCLNNLADLYLTQNEDARVEPLLKRSLAIWERALGVAHPTTVTVREKYTDLVRKMNYEGEATEDEDAAFLQMKPISRKRMDLLWLGPQEWALLEQSLSQREVVSPTIIYPGEALLGGLLEYPGRQIKLDEITREDFQFAKQIEPIMNKADAAGQSGNYSEAIQYYREALQLAPGCDLFLMSLGVCYNELGQTTKGLRYLERAAQLSPDNAQIQNNLAIARLINAFSSEESDQSFDQPAQVAHDFKQSPQEVTSALRLCDPGHPARRQIDEATKIVDQYIRVEVAGKSTVFKGEMPIEELGKALSSLEEGIAMCPTDMDLLVAKACVLQLAGQKAAEKVLDVVLNRAPDHFEAKMWKNHWKSWFSTLGYPKWNQEQLVLHPVMVAHLHHIHPLQIVRDGLQKTLAIITTVQGPPLDSRTQIKMEWILSQTPYGPLVAWYQQIIEPANEPSIMEAFLPIFQPMLFNPGESYFLMQQLAFTPYCFVVLVNGDKLEFNRRVIFGEKDKQKIRDIASRLSSAQVYLPQHQLQNAVQWHMANFDMKQLTFK